MTFPAKRKASKLSLPPITPGFGILQSPRALAEFRLIRSAKEPRVAFLAAALHHRVILWLNCLNNVNGFTNSLSKQPEV